MTKPRLVKVRALFYVLQQIQKEAAPILTQPLHECATFPYVSFFRNERLVLGGANISFCGLYEDVGDEAEGKCN